MKLQYMLILGAVLVVAAAAWFVWQGTPANDAATTNPTTAAAVPEAREGAAESEIVAGFGSFAELLGLGQNIVCEYSYQDTETGDVGSGTGYFADARMRLDSTVTTDGVTYDSSMINDGEYMYSWTTSTDGDFAVKLPTPEDTVDSDAMYDTSETDNQGQVTLDQQVEYDCRPWRVDTSRFVPPQDIEFMDMAAMMQEALQGLPEGFEMPEGFPGQ